MFAKPVDSLISKWKYTSRAVLFTGSKLIQKTLLSSLEWKRSRYEITFFGWNLKWRLFLFGIMESSHHLRWAFSLLSFVFFPILIILSIKWHAENQLPKSLSSRRNLDHSFGDGWWVFLLFFCSLLILHLLLVPSLLDDHTFCSENMLLWSCWVYFCLSHFYLLLASSAGISNALLVSWYILSPLLLFLALSLATLGLL